MREINPKPFKQCGSAWKLMNLNNIFPPNPHDVIFWTGAGISIDSPASLPSGPSLTEEVVKTYCINNTYSDICDYLKKAQIEDSHGKPKNIPRLEAILGCIISILGFEILNDFSFLDAPPNHFHHFFAHHIMSGGAHITMNLDLCLENAIEDFLPHIEYQVITPDNIPLKVADYKQYGWILHLHGKYGSNLRSLGLTIDNVARGISDDLSNLIIETIKSKRTIVFLGYSGSDVFDVNPFFETLKYHSDFTGKYVIWLDFSPNGNSPEFVRYDGSYFRTSILNSLSECKAEIYVWHGNTIDIINALRDFWGFPIFSKEHRMAKKKKSISGSIEEWKKEIITAKIYISMGLGERALTLCNNIDLSSELYESYCTNRFELMELSPLNRLSYISNEANREVGLYFNANKITERFIQLTDLDKMLYLERYASDLWLMGKLFKARNIYAEALSFGIKKIGNSYKFDTLYIECLRGYMQLCRDLGRLPILGKIFIKTHIKAALDTIIKNSLIEKALKHSPYDRSHITRLFIWEMPNLKETLKLPSWLTDVSNIMSVFLETDNLLGTINTTRSEIKTIIYSRKRVENKRLQKLIELSELISDYPGIVKACQLIVYNDGFEKKYSKLFLTALFKTQWVVLRKFYEILIFCWYCIKSLQIKK